MNAKRGTATGGDTLVARPRRGTPISRRTAEVAVRQDLLTVTRIVTWAEAPDLYRRVPIGAPVRPTMKERYPLTPMDRYIRWTRQDGLPFDPWIRVHHRLGAAILAVAPHSLVVTGAVAEWEEWTGMAFPETGDYVVPGAVQ